MNSRKLGEDLINELIKVEGISFKRVERGRLYLAEGDELLLFEKHKFGITKILSTEAFSRAAGDKQDAVYMQPIEN